MHEFYLEIIAIYFQDNFMRHLLLKLRSNLSIFCFVAGKLFAKFEQRQRLILETGFMSGKCLG